LAHAATRRRVLAVLLLGLNLWTVALLWPWLTASPSTSGAGSKDLAVALACLAPLLLGAGAHGAFAQRLSPPPWIAGALWLAVYPAALAVALAVRPEALNQESLGPVALALLAVALCAYGASASAACVEKSAELNAAQSALGAEPWDAPESEQRPLQRVIVAVLIGGAAAIAVVAPSVGGFAALETAWGDAALSGGVLTSVIGAALGVTAIGVFLGSGLRSEGENDGARGDRALRTAWFLFLALFGAVTYFVVTP
jgi:hypothetical protein